MNWLWENRSWLFSGAGIAAVTLLIWLVRHLRTVALHPKSEGVTAGARIENASLFASPIASGSNISQTIQNIFPPASPKTEIATPLGNLRKRCTNLAEELHQFRLERDAKRETIPYPPSKENLTSWYTSTGMLFRRAFLPRVLDMQRELATLHIRDEQLDRTLDRMQTPFGLTRTQQTNPSEMVKLLLVIDTHEIRDISERLMTLVGQIPS